MNVIRFLHLFPILLGAALGAALAVYAWKRRPAPSATPMTALALAIAGWSLFYALQLLTPSLAQKRFWLKLQYLGIVSVPVAWLWLALAYTGAVRWLRGPKLVILTAIPASTILIMWLAPTLFWTGNELLAVGPLSFLAPGRGPWFWVHASYSYLLLLAGCVIMVRTAVDSPNLYRWQVAALLLSLLLPWAANALYLLRLVTLDLTPFTLALSCLVLTIATFRVRLMDVLPVARAVVLESMSDPVFVVDAKFRVVDANRATGQLSRRRPDELISMPLSTIPEIGPALLTAAAAAPGPSAEIAVGAGPNRRFYQVRVSTIQDRRGRAQAKLLICHDVSQQKQRERELAYFVTVSRALRSVHRSREMVPIILDEAKRLLQADAGLLVVPGRGGPAQITAARGAWAPLSGKKIAGAALKSFSFDAADRQFFRAGNLSRLPGCEQWQCLAPYSAVVAAPLRQEDGIRGVVLIGRRDPFTPAEGQALLAIAEIAAIALSRAAILETVEERVAERTRDLNQANERLRGLDRLRTQMIDNVGHELRTPVTTTGLYLELLRHGDDSARARYLDVLQEQYVRLNQVVESVLRFSQLEAITPGEALEVVDLEVVVREAVGAIRPRAEARGLAVAYRPVRAPAQVRGFAPLLAEALSYLLDNAVKYTPAGTISVATISDGRSRSGIEVRDTGIGIAASDLPHVCDRFYRGRQVREMTTPGPGLGLSLVRQIAVLHDGSVEIESEVDVGTTVRLWLGAPAEGRAHSKAPAAVTAPAQAASRAITASASAARARRWTSNSAPSP